MAALRSLVLALAIASSAALTVAVPGAARAQGQEVRVAVVTSFAEALEALEPAFEAATGHDLVIAPGSTGKLFAQILTGAPYAVLLAGDAQTPIRLEAESAAVPGTSVTYAIGRLALWSASPDLVVGDGAALLANGDYRNLAIANPEVAPHGIAARETLQSLDLWEALADRLVIGQNVGQAHSLVATGAAELGFVGISAIQSPRNPIAGSFWQVPQELYKPIRLNAALLLPGQGNQAAAAFLDYLTGPEARELIQSYGYALP